MKDYSQNGEQKIILEYFGDFVGVLLDIGANDGVTLSNSRALIEKGWIAHLVEPSPSAFKMLIETSEDDAYLFNFAIGTYTGKATFYESGAHLGTGDTALLSSLKQDETKRWKKETFTPIEVDVFRYEDTPFYGMKFDFITIDAEGMDYEILIQIDLTDTKMVCVEFNGKNAGDFIGYCAKYGLQQVWNSHENLIFAR